MSLILDALRKIELERKAKRQSSQEIRSEVLNYRGIAPVSEKSRIIPVTAALLLISAAAAGFFYLKNPETAKTDQTRRVETLNQEQTPITVPKQSPPTLSERPLQKIPEAETGRSTLPARPAAKTVTVKQGAGGDGITVSGIAWQDERVLRRAVINGSLVGEGAEIQGAKIVEIKENRVRFSRGSDIFEVVHSSGTGRQP